MKKSMCIVAVFFIFLFNACSGGGGSDGSNALYPPAMPTGLAVTELDESTVTIEWTDNADNESGFVIERSTNGGEYDLVFTSEPDEMKFTENLPDDTIYSYRIYAFNSAGDSDVSNEASVKRPKSAQVEITTDAGGVIELANLATITFPSDSFSSNETVEAIEGVMRDSIAEGKEPYIDLVSDIKAVNIIDLTAKNLILKKNIKLVMNYDPNLLAEINQNLDEKNAELIAKGIATQADIDKMKFTTSDLHVYFFNAINNKWIKTNAVIDTTQHTFTLETSFLGIYCVGYSETDKTGFSIESNPELQIDIIDTFYNPDKHIDQNSSSSSKSSGTCPNACYSSSKSIGVPIWYSDDCVLSNGRGDFDRSCDNCSSIAGFTADSMSLFTFTNSCKNHDGCYRYGFTTYGYTQLTCDLRLGLETSTACANKYPFGKWVTFRLFWLGPKVSVWVPIPTNWPFRITCNFLSGVVYSAVAAFGDSSVVSYDSQLCFDYYKWGVNCNIPILRNITLSSYYCEPSETIDLTSSVYNPENRSLTYTWSATTGTISNASSANITWTAPAAIPDDTEVALTLKISDGTNTIPSKTRTIPIRKPYTITYNANGADSGTTPAIVNHVYYGSSIYIAENTGNLARTAFYFAGWNSQADGNGFDRNARNFFIMGKENVVFYAKWLPTYRCYYNGNGNTGGTPPVDAVYYKPGMSVTVEANINLVKPGYYFAGWNTQSDGNGSDIGSYFTIGNNDIIVYAKWLPTYTVTYDGNGKTSGNAPTDSNNYLQGATVNVLGNTGNLQRIGYNFTGWNTQTDGNGNDRGVGGSFTMYSSNVFLYAKWSAYPVTYSGNGNTSGSVPSDTTNYMIGDNVTVKYNTGDLARNGYTFQGWESDSTSYSEGQVFQLSTSTKTFNAKWLAIPYTVSFNSMGGSSVAAQIIPYGSNAVMPAIPTKGGFDFGGWYWDIACTNAWNQTEPIISDISLYAKWTYKWYELRDVGPAGGLIFYIETNQALVNSRGWKYLEAAPFDQSAGIRWYPELYNIPTTGATGTAIGTGRSNTTLIVNAQGAGSYAAKLCDDLTITNNGINYSDWFLPSRDELWLMCWELKGVKFVSGGPALNTDVPVGGVGGFVGRLYWSSSDSFNSSAWYQYFDNGLQINNGNKSGYLCVHAIRAF